MDGNSSKEQSRQYESKHLQALALALGSGLLVAFLGRLLNLQIPFVAMVLLVALLIFGFERSWDTTKNRGFTEVRKRILMQPIEEIEESIGDVPIKMVMMAKMLPVVSSYGKSD